MEKVIRREPILRACVFGTGVDTQQDTGDSGLEVPTRIPKGRSEAKHGADPCEKHEVLWLVVDFSKTLNPQP